MTDSVAFDALARLLPSLGLIVGALLLLRRWARRGGGPASGLRVVGRTGVTRNAVVAVVEVGVRRFLVGAGDHGVSLLSELEPAPPGRADPTEHATDAVQDVAQARPALPTERPWSGLADRLRRMTVRTHLEGPLHETPQ